MRRSILLAAFALAACEAMPGPAPGSSGSVDGRPASEVPTSRGCESLVPIEAADTAEGVARERAWLAENYPGFEVLNETQEQCGDVPVDRVVFVHAGIQHTIYFDTSSFYGRVDGDDLDDLLDG